MDTISQRFCWVKIAPNPALASAAPSPNKSAQATIAPRPDASKVCDDLHSDAVNRAPDAPAFGAESSAHLETGMHLTSGNRPPGAPAVKPPPGQGSTVTQARTEGDPDFVTLDRIYDGVRSSGTTASLAPMVGSRDDAIAWLTGPAGVQWYEDSVTYFLVCVSG